MSAGPPPAPHHATPAPSPAPNRRLLLLSYHFAPDPAVGALRWLKMSLTAAERGWGLDVVALDPSALERRDDALLAELPPHVRLFGVDGRPPWWARAVLGAWGTVAQARARRQGSTTARAADGDEGGRVAAVPPPSPPSITRREVEAVRNPKLKLRRAFFTASYNGEHRAWARAATALAQRVVRPEHRVIVASGPPHMAAQEAGRLLARRTGLPFVMDMRDPWSLVHRVSEPLASVRYFREAEYYERLALDAAALVACNTDAAAAALRQRHPDAAARIITVMNGSDLDPLPEVPRESRFLVAYTGAIYWDRDPRPLFRAAARVVRERGLRPDQFGIHFMGMVHAYEGRSLDEIVAEIGLADHFRHSSPSPRAEAMRLLGSASMLVSLPQDSHLALPSKIFEYSRFPAWLLALAEPRSATEMLLRDTSADVVSSQDEEAIARVLGARYDAFARGERPTPVDAAGRFDRRRQANILFDRLDTLTSATSAR